MHYYKRNLGDYAKKAGRLSMVQHGAYTLLMDSCYDREQFPTLEEAIDWTWASSKEEVEAVEFVLKRFFVLEGTVYVQPRIKEELDEYHAKAETNKRIALDREEKRRQKESMRLDIETNRARTVNDTYPDDNASPPNQEPRTKNQELRTNISPKPPRGRKPAIEIQTFIDQCKAEGVKTLPPGDPVFKLAEEAGIPSEFLRLAWVEFKDHCQANNKRQSDWRKTFRNYVRGNYLKLWYLDDNKNYQLTTVGKQAETRFGERA